MNKNCCCSVVQSCLDCNTLGFPVLHHLLELVQTHIHRASDAIQPSRLCHSLFLLLSNFPHISVFSNESVLRIRLPKYWSFSFSISPSNEYLGLFFIRVDWFDLFAVQGTLKSLLQHHSSKASILWCSASFMVQLSHSYIAIGKNHSFDYMDLCWKVMALLFNTLLRFAIVFLPRSKWTRITTSKYVKQRWTSLPHPLW